MENQILLMITKVKNEADIIESFLRYHSYIFDKIVVIENGSIDGTFEIINALIQEGLNIEIVNEAACDFDDFRMANKYTAKYVKETNADYVVFMDADEFLISDTTDNPRNVIENLDKNKIYYLKWKTYIYENIEEDVDFVPLKFPIYRDEEKETFTKIIVPGELYLKNRIIIREGNHDFTCTKIIGTELLENLKFAHYPVRSKNQYIKQVLLNIINIMSNPKKTLQKGEHHWKKMYQIQAEEIDLNKESLGYSLYKGNQSYSGAIKDIFRLKNKIKYKKMIKDNLQQILLYVLEIQSLKLKAERLNNIKKERNKEQILVYGTGELCEEKIDKIDIGKYEIVAFVDSNKEKQLQTYNDKVVITPEKMRFFSFNRIIIASNKYESEMKEKIKNELPRFPEDNIISIENFIIEEYQKGLE